MRIGEVGFGDKDPNLTSRGWGCCGRRELMIDQCLLQLWASAVEVAGMVSSWLYIMKQEGGAFLPRVLQEQVRVGWRGTTPVLHGCSSKSAHLFFFAELSHILGMIIERSHSQRLPCG